MAVGKQRRATNDIAYIVTLKVRNGAYKYKREAEADRMALMKRNKKIGTSPATKSGNGYFFNSYAVYGVPNAKLRNQLMKKLNEYKTNSKVPNSRVSITSRKA